MINRATLKDRAKAAFQGHYWLCVALFAIFGAITGTVTAGASFSGSGASSFGSIGNAFKGSGGSGVSPAIAIVFAAIGIAASLVGILYYIFVGGPISVSAAKTGLNVYDGFKPAFRDIVYCFRDGRYRKCIGGMALYLLFSMLACFVVMIPLMIITIVLGVMSAEVWQLSEEATIAVFVLGSVISAFASAVPAVVVGMGLSQTPYVIADEGLSGMDAIRRSWEIMRGHKWERFVLELSFIGWGLLTAITWGVVGIFFAGPYMNVTYAGYYRELTRGEKFSEAQIV